MVKRGVNVGIARVIGCEKNLNGSYEGKKPSLYREKNVFLQCIPFHDCIQLCLLYTVSGYSILYYLSTL